MSNYVYTVKEVSNADDFVSAILEGYTVIKVTKEYMYNIYNAVKANVHINDDVLVEQARMLIEGEGKKDPAKAFSILMDLVDNKVNYKAYHLLGYCYLNGIEVKKDIEQAIYWYSQAAEANFAPSQHQIGLFYEDGVGVEEDESQAFYWFSLAAEQGFGESQLKVAEYFEKGKTIDVDMTQAFYWYQEAANQGYLSAQNKAASMLRDGVGVDKDEKLALEWFTRTAEQGDATAMLYLGDAYEKGTLVEKNEDKAMEWYKHSAEKGNEEAQYRLGMKFLKSNDIATAINYLMLAANQGNTIADGELDRLILDLKSQNRCIHCGGEIKGLFTKKCVVCGTKKDY